jgi:DnaJ-domain-containing protein 1
LNEDFARDFGFLTRFKPETLTLEQAYKALNASPESSIEEISRVRRNLVHQNHPDKFATHDEKYRRLAEHEMKVINRAYDLIMRQKTTN